MSFDAAALMYHLFKLYGYNSATCEAYGDGNYSEISLFDSDDDQVAEVNFGTDTCAKEITDLRELISFGLAKLVSSKIPPSLPLDCSQQVTATYEWYLDEDKKIVVCDSDVMELMTLQEYYEEFNAN